MTNRGFALIHRSAFREDHFLHPSNRQGDATWRDAWTYLILAANWGDGTPHPGIPEGHIQIGARGLAQNTALSKSAANRFLARLKSEDMVRVAHKTPDNTEPNVLHLVNYGRYQSPNRGGTRSGTRGGTRENSDSNSAHGGDDSSTTDHRDAGWDARRDTGRDAARDVNKKEKNREQKNNNNMAPVSGADPSNEPFDRTSLFGSEPDDAESQLEKQVREVEQHWIDLLADLDLTSEEEQVLLSSDKREHARSKFRARIRDDSFSVEDLQRILSWALAQYWDDDDRLPWGGNVHPRSIIQNGDKARERLLTMRQNGVRRTEDKSDPTDVVFERRRKRMGIDRSTPTIPTP